MIYFIKLKYYLLGARILRVKISQLPEDGKVNKASIEMLAEYLSVKKIQSKLLLVKNRLIKLLRLNNANSAF